MKQRITSLLCALLALTMVLQLTGAIRPMTVSAVKSSSQIKSEIEELQAEQAELEEELEGLRGQLSDNLEDMEAMVAQKNLIDQEIFLLHEQVSNTNDQIASYSDLIANKQEELDTAQAHLQQLQVQNKARIRAMEKNGTLSYWSVIFKANSFTDLLDRLKMVQEIAEADQRRMAEMAEAAQAVAAAKQTLETEKTALEDTKKELEKTQAELEARRAEANELLSQLVAKGAEYQALVDAAEQAAEELADDISAAEEDYDEAKDREYQQWLASQPSTPPSSSGVTPPSNSVDGVTWMVPINYTAFTSPYGYRWHPVHGDWRFHYGVDLAAPEGTPIVATRSGIVSRANYDWSSGYHVYINHQDGFSSRYLHMTHYIVSEGQYVSAGQVIGYCGTTGTSTGNHLHFGIYYNGSSVNPALYINI